MTCPDIRILPSVNYVQPRLGKTFDESATTTSLTAGVSSIVRERQLPSKCFSWFGPGNGKVGG
jgi:hypothetical protein